MNFNWHFKTLFFSLLLSFVLFSCEDAAENKTETLPQSEAPALPVPEVQVPENQLELPEVDLKKIQGLTKQGKYGNSAFFHYLNSNFKTISNYSQEGLIEGSEILTYLFENDITYDSQIHVNNPKHFIESFSLPNADMEEVKKTLILIYPEIEFTCEKSSYCEYSFYGDEGVRKYWLEDYEGFVRVGITYR